MTQYKRLRDCPACGAHKGFCCREPLCPQAMDSDLMEITGLNYWPTIPVDYPKDDDTNSQ